MNQHSLLEELSYVRDLLKEETNLTTALRSQLITANSRIGKLEMELEQRDWVIKNMTVDYDKEREKRIHLATRLQKVLNYFKFERCEK